MLERLRVSTQKVRSPEELEKVDALVIPGGESTTMGKLLVRSGLLGPLRRRAENGMAIFGTCAGMILLAREILGYEQPRIGLMDITVERNAYGRQIESFETEISTGMFSEKPLKAIFIRAPRITRLGEQVEVLAHFEDVPVFVRENTLLASSFHPELTEDTRMHEYFLSIV
jgi:5'-phosphate synthase pdxT subunit